MAMLAALCAAAKSGKNQSGSAEFYFSCIHVEHGIRPAEESLGDAEYVRGFCKENGIKCAVTHIRPGKIEDFARCKGTGIEAAARFFRHRALKKKALTSGENTVTLLAHTKDDLLETAVMRVLRGCGPGGLAAMPPVSGKPDYVIARPLLTISGAFARCYLEAKNIAWREDSTNAGDKFTRNRIRRRLIPLLDENFPSWRTGTAAMAQTQSLAADFIAKEAGVRIKWETPQKFPHKDAVETGEAAFFSQPQIIREEAVYQAITGATGESLQIKTIKRKVVRKFCEGGINSADLGTVRIRREKGKIFIFKTRKEYFEKGISRLIK